jgi:hemerythrin-like domain-containing protein
MYGIDLLVEEHKNIYALTEHLNKTCCAILEGAEIDVEEFRECIDFIRNYADKHHHGKEEQILFQFMLQKNDPAAEKLVRNGMLVEHDLARYHVKELEQALTQYEGNPTSKAKLDILSHAAGYAELLQRHINKENEVCYTYAERLLSEECKALIDEQTKSFEEKAHKEHVQEKYLAWIEQRR